MDINDDLEPEPEPQTIRSMSHAPHHRGQSYSMDQRTQTLIKQYETRLSELQKELKQSQDENEALIMKNETMMIEYDEKIDQLNLEIDEQQIESQQYQLRYSEINEELQDLRSKQNEELNTDQQNK